MTKKKKTTIIIIASIIVVAILATTITLITINKFEITTLTTDVKNISLKEYKSHETRLLNSDEKEMVLNSLNEIKIRSLPSAKNKYTDKDGGYLTMYDMFIIEKTDGTIYNINLGNNHLIVNNKGYKVNNYDKFRILELQYIKLDANNPYFIYGITEINQILNNIRKIEISHLQIDKIENLNKDDEQLVVNKLNELTITNHQVNNTANLNYCMFNIVLDNGAIYKITINDNNLLINGIVFELDNKDKLTEINILYNSLEEKYLQ